MNESINELKKGRNECACRELVRQPVDFVPLMNDPNWWSVSVIFSFSYAAVAFQGGDLSVCASRKTCVRPLSLLLVVVVIVKGIYVIPYPGGARSRQHWCVCINVTNGLIGKVTGNVTGKGRRKTFPTSFPVTFPTSDNSGA